MMPPSGGHFHWWSSHKKRPDSGHANSGLTGDSAVEPIETEEPKDLRDRLRDIVRSVRATSAALPRVLRLVWDASPALTLGLFFATLIAGAVPAAMAYTAKLLVNAVVQAIIIHRSNLPDQERLSIGPWQSPVVTVVGAVVFLAVLQLVLFAISSLLGTIRNITQQLLQNAVAMRIQLMVMEKAASLELAFYEDPASYDLLRRAQTDSINRPVQMISTAFGLVQTLLTFVTMIALLLAVSPLLALLAFISPIPAFVADTRYGRHGYRIAWRNSRLVRRMNYLVTLLTTDSFAKEVKLFGLGEYFIQRYRLIAETYYGSQRTQIVRRYLAGFGWGNLTTIATSATYLYVALQAVVGRLTLGDLALYTAAAQSVQSSIQGTLSGFSQMYEHNLYLTNLFELMATKPSMPVAASPVKVGDSMRGEITFDNVTFSYPGAGKDALTDLSFTVRAGETIAIVGRNGAGKTTLFKLICRLYDPSKGRILVDGVDIRQVDPDDLRSQVGAMFQDYVDYQATAAENIGLGNVRSIADRHAIANAARSAGADELIAGLPDGYDTALGKWFDAGVNLSGGEWQKVALARAFIRDAKILLLDEPTSALDAQAEYDLFARLKSLTRGRTSVYISHRFSTVRQADRIVFLEHGRLVEQGTHVELMALGGRYASLFRMQASAYTGDYTLTEIVEELPPPSERAG
jgi:ATP-binding cassette subfamily B protein